MSQSGEGKRRRTEGPQQTWSDIPTPEASRAAIEDLMAIWPTSPAVTVTANDDAFLLATSVWVFGEHAIRTARAVLVLDDQRMYMQCGPLARLVYECGVTAAWMVRTPHSGQSVFAAAKRSYDLLMKDLAQMAGVPVPEDDPDAMTGLEDAKQLPKFWARAKALDDGKWIHPYYRMLSGVSHGEGPLVQEYLQETEVEHACGHRFQFRNPEQYPWRHVLLALTAVALNFALWSWDEVSKDHPLQADLEQVGQKHHLGSRPIFDYTDPAKTAEPAPES